MAQLTDLEIIALKWQYKFFGDFYQLLMKLISTADEQNLNQLKLAFPQHVEAYITYKTIPGWWDNTLEKAKSLNWFAPQPANSTLSQQIVLIPNYHHRLNR